MGPLVLQVQPQGSARARRAARAGQSSHSEQAWCAMRAQLEGHKRAKPYIGELHVFESRGLEGVTGGGGASSCAHPRRERAVACTVRRHLGATLAGRSRMDFFGHPTWALAVRTCVHACLPVSSAGGASEVFAPFLSRDSWHCAAS